MTEEQAHQFAEFIKDHDKRFESKAKPDGDQSTVGLVSAADGTVLDPIADILDYQRAQIDEHDPGPTVKAAWDQWRVQQYGG